MFERQIDSLLLTDTENLPECSCHVNKVCFALSCALQSGRDVPKNLADSFPGESLREK